MAQLSIDIRGCRNDRGHVMVGIVDDPAQFPRPSDPETWLGTRVPIRGGEASALFEDLPPGRYAIAVFHDENDNEQLDTNWLGLPREGFGFGNDAAGKSQPHFDDCAVDVPGSGAAVGLRMRYLGRPWRR